MASRGKRVAGVDRKIAAKATSPAKSTAKRSSAFSRAEPMRDVIQFGHSGHPLREAVKARAKLSTPKSRMTIRKVDGEYQVKPRGSRGDAKTYFTNDRADAHATAKAMDRAALRSSLIKRDRAGRANLAARLAKVDKGSVAASHAGGSEAVKSYTMMRGGKNVVVRGYTRKG